VHLGDVSAYVENVDVIPLSQTYNCKEHEGKNDKNRRTQTSAGCAQACNNNFNSLFIYLRADSTAIGHLQSQHGHIQQKQWTTQGQCTKTSGLYRQVLNKCVHKNLNQDKKYKTIKLAS
jgi:hypothetical protein